MAKLISRWHSFSIRAPRQPRRVRSIAVALAGPALVTLLALPERHVPGITVAVLYVLAVVVSAGVGGASAGMLSSLVSFLALNFFFTQPLHTFAVGSPADVVALLVFLSVSVIVGLLLSAAVAEKSRVERREIEARLLNRLATRLLAGDEIEDVLQGLSEGMVRSFGLARCEIETTFTQPVSSGDSEALSAVDAYEVELAVKSHRTGVVRAWAASPDAQLDHDEQAVMEAFAKQLGLALESMRLSIEIRRAELDAESSRLKTALFSGVTHDVKTPLGAITTSVTSLLEGSGFTPEENREHLETIRQEAERLHRVVNNLLDLSRVRAGALTPSKTPSPMDELIESVVARLQPVLNGRHVEIRTRDDMSEVPMDVVQIDQVLTNLIENAAKFTPEGTPLSIAVVGHAAGLRVTVADRGPGVPKENQLRIFEPFERGDGTTAGTGLGLAIAAAIVTAHGGRMWVGDAPGGGAAFTFELPRDGASSSPSETDEDERARPRS